MMIREQLELRETEILSPYASPEDGNVRKKNVISVRCFNGIVTGSFTARHFAG